MENIRKKILRVHGTIAITAGTIFAVASTIGMAKGVGLFKFLEFNKMGHVGLYQAYLLFSLIGVVLLVGSRQENVKKWNRIGAASHALILTVYIIHWNFFPTIDGGEFMRDSGCVFHFIFLSIESWAGFISK